MALLKTFKTMKNVLFKHGNIEVTLICDCIDYDGQTEEVICYCKDNNTNLLQFAITHNLGYGRDIEKNITNIFIDGERILGICEE